MSEWMIDFTQVVSPKKNVSQFTVFKVPIHLSPRNPVHEDFKVRMLQLGLHNRTALSDNSSDTVFQNLKLEIAAVLHKRLTNPPSVPPPASVPPKSWTDFAELVLDNVQIAQDHFEKPTQTPTMTPVEIRNHLALDALFIIFYFQYLNGRKFNIKEFDKLAKDRRAVLRSLDMSDFLLLENQVPMYLLKNTVRALCTIDDQLPEKLSGHEDIIQLYRSRDPIEILVEQELNRILLKAVWALLPVSAPIVVNPISAPQASSWDNIVKVFHCEEESLNADQILVKYLGIYYPPHLDAALEKSKHLLDCVYRVVSGDKGPPEEYEWDESLLHNPPLVSIPSATQLEDLGIKVKCSTQCTTDSVELTHGPRTWFCSALLRLPNVNIYDDTGRVLRNLAVYEQLLGQDMVKYRGDLRCFLLCMLQLCRERTDLELLCENKVLNVTGRNKDALSMWGRILEGLEAPVPSEVWREFLENLGNHRQSVWKPMRRTLFGKFMRQPWIKVSIFAATILLVLTFLQTWFTVVNSDSSKWKWPTGE